MALPRDLAGPLLQVEDAPSGRDSLSFRRAGLTLVALAATVGVFCALTSWAKDNTIDTPSLRVAASPQMPVDLTEEPVVHQQLLAVITRAAAINWNAPNIFLCVVDILIVLASLHMWLAPDNYLKSQPEALAKQLPLGCLPFLSAELMSCAAGVSASLLTGGWRATCQLSWFWAAVSVVAHYQFGNKHYVVANSIVTLLYAYFGFVYSGCTSPGVLALAEVTEWTMAPNIFLCVVASLTILASLLMWFKPKDAFKSSPTLGNILKGTGAPKILSEFCIGYAIGGFVAVLSGGWKEYCQLNTIGLGVSTWNHYKYGDKNDAVSHGITLGFYLYFGFLRA